MSLAQLHQILAKKLGFQCCLIKKRAVNGRLLGQKKEALNRDCGDEPHSPRSSGWPVCPISWLSEWESDSSTSLGRVVRGNSLILCCLYRLSFLLHETELSGTHEADLSITVGKPHSRWSWWLIWITNLISRCESKSSSTSKEGTTRSRQSRDWGRGVAKILCGSRSSRFPLSNLRLFRIPP